MTPTDALWNALVSRIESDGGVMHRSSFDEVVAAFMRPVAEPVAAAVAPFLRQSVLDKARACHALARGQAPATPPPVGVFKVGDKVTVPRDKLNDTAWCAFARHGRWTCLDKCDEDGAVFCRYA